MDVETALDMLCPYSLGTRRVDDRIDQCLVGGKIMVTVEQLLGKKVLSKPSLDTILLSLFS